jgi:hypothetical protein
VSGGGQEIQINPSERAVSDDQNRSQRFRGLDLNELLRAIADTFYGQDDLGASSQDQQSAATGTPPSSAVYGGLVVRPAVASLALTITTGTIGLYDPDASPNPDESQYKVIRDPGTTSLTMTVNASGSTRIDVIECARVTNGFSVLETDMRDIFSSTTGLFSASTVVKVIAGRLQYRVRAGTPGAGYPGAATGWVPLAVASVPTGTTTNDTISFWDVRPLVADRWNAPFNMDSATPRTRQSTFQIDNGTNPAVSACGGYVEATAAPSNTFGINEHGGQYRLGGFFGTTTVDLALAANHAGSITNGVAYVYLCEPFGLPRWASYTPASSGSRQPCNPRGVTLLSSTAPQAYSGSPSAPLTLTTTPLGGGGGTVSKAVCIGVTSAISGVAFSLATDGDTQSSSGVPYATVNGTPGGAGTFVDYSLVAGTNYPPNARSLTIDVSYGFTINATSNTHDAPTLGLQTSGGGGLWFQNQPPAFFSNPTGGGVGGAHSMRVKIPVPPTAAAGFDVHLVAGGPLNGFMTSGTLDVVGWDLV